VTEAVLFTDADAVELEIIDSTDDELAVGPADMLTEAVPLL